MYLYDIPVGVLVSPQVYYVHTDYLNTPRLITDITNNTKWSWSYSDPHGNSSPVSTGLTYNLRFPGQFADQESGLFYNMNRYYNPTIGRYTQVDPIGLNGCINPYAYVDNNPVNAIDSTGNAGVIYNLTHDSNEFLKIMDNIGFTLEMGAKANYAIDDPNTIYFVGHAAPMMFGGLNGKQLANQLITGKFNQGQSPLDFSDNYLQNMLKLGQAINIVLDGCNAGAENWSVNNLGKLEQSPNVAQAMGKTLRDYLNQKGYSNTPINIDTPDGYAAWTGLSGNPRNDWISSGTILGVGNNSGTWKHYKF